jgi:hypothetical protein
MVTQLLLRLTLEPLEVLVRKSPQQQFSLIEPLFL